MKYVDPLRAP